MRRRYRRPARACSTYPPARPCAARRPDAWRWALVYVPGLIGPGERKSVQLMAARLGLSGNDQLRRG
jgi:hypothetical protein